MTVIKSYIIKKQKSIIFFWFSFYFCTIRVQFTISLWGPAIDLNRERRGRKPWDEVPCCCIGTWINVLKTPMPAVLKFWKCFILRRESAKAEPVGTGRAPFEYLIFYPVGSRNGTSHFSYKSGISLFEILNMFYSVADGLVVGWIGGWMDGLWYFTDCNRRNKMDTHSFLKTWNNWLFFILPHQKWK